MNLKVWALTEQAPTLHPAGMFILVACAAISFSLRKSFCSWLCPGCPWPYCFSRTDLPSTGLPARSVPFAVAVRVFPLADTLV